MRPCPLLLSLSALLLAGPVPAAQTPASVGPFGLRCNGVRVDPDDPNTIVAAVQYGTHALQRSTDGGATWSAIASVPGSFSYGVRGSGADRVVAIVDSGVWVSEDDGETFALVHDLGSNLTLLAVHPTQDVWLAASPIEMWRTDDAGATWTSVFTTVWTNSNRHEPVFAPSDPSRVYFCTNGELYRSFDAGATWEETPIDLGSYWEIAVDPFDADGVHVGNHGHVWASTDGGDWFTDLGAPVPLMAVEELAFEPGPAPRLWAATNNSNVYAADGEGGWDLHAEGLEIVTSAIANQMTFAHGDLWLGSSNGLWRAAGSAMPWTRVGFAQRLLYTAAIPVPGEQRLVAGSSSVYGGEGVEVYEDLIVPFNDPRTTLDLEVDPKDPTRWFAAQRDSNSYVPLLEITESGAATQYAGICGPCDDFRDVDFNPFDLDQIVAAVEGHVPFLVVTYDDGATWTRQYGLPFWGTVALSFDPFVPGRVLAHSIEGHVMQSLDSTATWTTLTPPTHNEPGTLDFDPHVPGRVFRASGLDGWERSDDGGTTWTSLGLATHVYGKLTFHPHQPDLVWLAGADGELWMSGDAGATAVQVFQTAEGSPVTGTALDVSDGSLVVATRGESAFVLPQHAPYLALGGGTPATTFGVPEHFAVGGLPQVGSAGWGLAVDGVAPGSLVALFVGASALELPLVGGTFHPGPPYLVIEAGIASGSGAASFALPLPSNPALAGLALTSQVAVADAGALEGAALSGGFRTTLL